MIALSPELHFGISTEYENFEQSPAAENLTMNYLLQVSLVTGYDIDSMLFEKGMLFYCQNVDESSMIMLFERGFFDTLPYKVIEHVYIVVYTML